MEAETKYWIIYYVTKVNNEFDGLSLYPQHYKRISFSYEKENV